MTFKILTDDTHKIVYCSNIKSVKDPNTPNLRLNLFNGEEHMTKFIKPKSDINKDQMIMIMTPDDMIYVPSLVKQEMSGRDIRKE